MNLKISGFGLAVFMLINLQAFSQTKPVKQVQYLSGTDNIHTKTWDFWATGGRKSGVWSKIEVPSHWEQQGFGSYNYGRDYVTYGKNFRFADEKGIYRHSFNIPLSWKGKDVFIVFEGSMTDTELKINGKSAGPTHKGAFYRFRYNISDKLNFGKLNQLEATVSKMSSDNSVNNAERLADYWIFGGIFRPVYLEAFPKEHIEWIAIDAKADGTFNMNVHLKNVKAGRTILAEIVDDKGKVVATGKTTTTSDSLANVKATVKNPKLWTAETPNRYQVNISVQNAGQSIYQTKEKFGFRTLEIRKSDGIYLNGTKIKMKGVNRHVWWPETGRAINPAIDLMDVKLIKEMNMNAVRCSHYPPDQSFLNLCDSLGLYVLDELAGWQKAYSTKAGIPLVKEMVIRDVNHPSIIFWSNGNEGGHNFDLDAEYGKYDLSKRTVIHAHHKPGNAFNGIDCNHYEDFYSSKKILADTNIYMPTEFLHAQDDGGGAASLADFWDLHWNEKKGAGGFIWDLADEGIVRTDQNNIIDVNGVNAPDGLVGPHREKEGSAYAIREIYSPVKIDLKVLPTAFNGEIEVENRYHFTNINQCRFKWELINFKGQEDRNNGYVVVKQGSATAPSIAPVAKGKLKIDLPQDWKNHDGLALMAYDPTGNEVYRWVWKIKSNTALFIKSLDRKPANATGVVTTEGDTTITMKASGISVTLSKKSGKLIQLANETSAALSFNNGPVLVSGNATFTDLKAYKEGDGYVVESSYTGDMKSVKWKMNANGWLEMTYEYALNGDYRFAGISFNYPENFVLGAKWLGKGPSRVWKNRTQGGVYNVWENRNNNTHTGSAPWIYPEFKGYFSDVVWLEMNTVQGKFTIASPENDLYVRLFNFYGLSGVASYPALPLGDISFLDAIPPIGSKLALNVTPDAKNLGPLGELNHINTTKKRTLLFYFGLPKSDAPQQFAMPKENILTN
ncbi:glycoside hydrolase family 2 [Pedobacter frigiditerrae]|uniref:Beta-galactosidase n=1 Tax=Pedobacter frigiditerrae TaxID=2530452 RepID=A0A4V2MIF4_9SPHI|nr:glycoside hydrolase family 2 TIM barrel-domain containing protein [Pedobacter frigiditerrae]TCC90196.1 glycoside hydrolase family 2 [Pedobacter frigiditerrae]